jgi:glycosyltransferase involved in cell wall biosynthesis
MHILIVSSFFIDPTKGGVQRVSSLLFEAFRRRGIEVFFLVLDGGEWSDVGNGDGESLLEQIRNRTYFLPEKSVFLTDKNVAFGANLIGDLGITHCINQSDIFSGVVDWMAAIGGAGVLGAAGTLDGGEHSGAGGFGGRKMPKLYSVHHNCVACLCNNYREIRFGGRVNTDRLNGKMGWSKDEILFRLMDHKWVWKWVAVMVKRKFRGLFNHVIQGSDKYVLLSESFRKELIDFGVDNTEKLVSVANPSTYTVEDVDTGLKENRVLFVGRVDHGQKRPDRMLRLFEKLHGDFPDWIFDVVGDGNAMEELREYATLNGLDRVIFHGFQDPKEFYVRAKIFVMTSDYEGLPMTIIEAQTLGAVPVAYNSFSSITEIITKDSGIIIDFGDDHGFEMAIQTLMSDSDLLQKMMVSGLQNAQKFAPDIIAQKWMELFEGK